MRIEGRYRFYHNLVMVGLVLCVALNFLVLPLRLHILSHSGRNEEESRLKPEYFFDDQKVDMGKMRYVNQAKPLNSEIAITTTVTTTKKDNINRTRTFEATPITPAQTMTPHHDTLWGSSLLNNIVNDSNHNIPDWMNEYFQWHKSQRSLLDATNFDQFRFLIMHCRESEKCGGTADRLKPFLLMLLVAFQTKRIFMIKWEKPCNLEEFLLPPSSLEDDGSGGGGGGGGDVNAGVGLDWRMPKFLQPHLTQNRRAATTMRRLIRSMNYTKLVILPVRYQSYDAGKEFYNQFRPDGPTFDQVYHDAWRMLFTPVPPIATQIQTQLRDMQLIPGRYAAAHVRAFRGVTTRNPDTIRLLTILSLNCVSQLILINYYQEANVAENVTIFFASDSSLAVQIALDYGKAKNATIVARKRRLDDENENPLHLEKSTASTSDEKRDPSDYYETFVDLYLLAMSRCMSFNIGGFGHWASLMSYNSSCSYRYGQLTRCGWMQTSEKNDDGLESGEDANIISPS